MGFQLVALFIHFFISQIHSDSLADLQRALAAAAADGARKKKANENIILIFEKHAEWEQSTHTPFVYLILKRAKSNARSADGRLACVWASEMLAILFVCALKRYNAYHLLRGVDFI